MLKITVATMRHVARKTRYVELDFHKYHQDRIFYVQKKKKKKQVKVDVKEEISSSRLFIY